MRTALIVVDVQNDFCEGGSLAVNGGDQIAAAIGRRLASHRSEYDLVVVTMDWHPSAATATFAHFAAEPDFVDTWPAHCVADTTGAALHPALAPPDDAIVVRKGQDSAAYSGFEGHDESGASLADVLDAAGIDAIDIVGLATDYCVKATALDARAHGLVVTVLSDLTAGVASDTTERALHEMAESGISIVP